MIGYVTRVHHVLLSLEYDKNRPSPFVKWAGGKSSLIQELLHYVPLDFSNYYEPFLGGGAFFFALYSRYRRFKAHLSDANAELINAYQIIKDKPKDLIELLSKIQSEYYGSVDKSRFFYEKRDWRPKQPLESAGRFIFLNKTCYNGLYRVNSRGEFNVPYGRYRNPKILDAVNITAVSLALRDTNAELSASDYKQAIVSCRKGDFVYLDPPYQPKTRTSSFTDYTSAGFSERDQRELAGQFGRLVSRGCTALLSNSETGLTSHLYSEYPARSVTVNRPINSKGSLRTGYREVVVFAGNPDQKDD